MYERKHYMSNNGVGNKTIGGDKTIVQQLIQYVVYAVFGL